jgi:predicted transposase/invertase (TIGR01784 family)
LRIEQYVIYIGKRALSMPAQVQGSDWCYRYHLIDMRHIDSEVFIAQDNPDALLLAVLCDFKGRDAQEMVNYIVLRLQLLLKDDSKQFRDYFTMLDILSDNRDLQPQVKKANEMLTQLNLEKSAIYQIGLERGVLDGIEKGIERGIERGKLVEKYQLAQAMLKKGLAMPIIMDITGLTEFEILKLS